MNHRPVLLTLLLGFALCQPGCIGTADDAYPIYSVPKADVLFRGGTVFDGTGGAPFVADLGVRDGVIVFLGDADSSGFIAAEEIDVSGLWVAPGFIDAHSHAALDEDYGKDGIPYLHQGITTVVLGVDGAGRDDVADHFELWRQEGIGVNGILFVGHGAARREVRPTDAPPPEARSRR